MIEIPSGGSVAPNVISGVILESSDGILAVEKCVLLGVDALKTGQHPCDVRGCGRKWMVECPKEDHNVPQYGLRGDANQSW